MKRAVTILTAAAVLLGLVAVPVSAAYPPPIPGCQTMGSTTAAPPWWLVYTSEIDGWRGGSFRISADCGRVVNYTSLGQRNGENCTMARLNYRYIDLITNWVVVCRTQTSRLHGMAPINESFYVECRDIHAAHRERSDGHCLFLLEF